MTLEQIHITELRAVRDAFIRDQKWHRQGCVQCGNASDHRRLSDECASGKHIRALLKAAQVKLKEARDEQKKPFPGQEALFARSEISSPATAKPAGKKGRTQ